MLAGKVAVVAGFGDVGKGVSQRKVTAARAWLIPVRRVAPIVWFASHRDRDRPYQRLAGRYG